MLSAACRTLLLPLHLTGRLSICRTASFSALSLPAFRQSAFSGTYAPRTHDCGALRASDVDSSVVLAGWLLPQRKISNSLSFFSIKDSNGTTQLVANRDTATRARVLDSLATVPVESVVLIQGSVRLRPQKAQRKTDPTGEVEVLIHDFTLLNPADHRSMPFLPSDIQNTANDELRARFRHLDLRRQSLSENLRKRSRVAHVLRDVLYNEDFVEVDTPLLLKSTPEGAREFLVPTRLAESGLANNKEPLFFSLAQSPQQPKQLLISSGSVDKYFQIARCFRDEDGRKDRQPEFTQVDLEMAFVSWGNHPTSNPSTDEWKIGGHEVRNITEALIRRVWKEVEGFELPDRFPVISYAEAMARYGSDKPDTRWGLEITNITSMLPPNTRENVIAAGDVVECFIIREDNIFVKGSEACEAEALEDVALVTVNSDNLSNWLQGSNIISETSSPLEGIDCSLINEGLDIKPGDNVWISRRKAAAEGGWTPLGRTRLRVVQSSQEFGLHGLSTTPHFVWVTEFPLFTRADRDKDFLANGRYSSSHHPFTAPMWQDIEKLYAGEIDSVRGQHYDLVLNGVEIGGGSVRIHDASMQEHVFTNVLQLTDAEKASFDHLLHALRCGAPPHGGIALGFDRLMAILCRTETIRDVIAFPKSSTGTDTFFRSPSAIGDETLRQYGLKKNN